MRSGRFYRGFSGVMNLHRQLTETELRERAQERADEAAYRMARAKPTGKLGDGRTANEDDLFNAGLFGRAGLVIGGYQGRILKYDGDAPLLTFLRAGGGKGVCYIQPNLAENNDRSLFITDLKDGELAWSSAIHRAKNLGHKVIIIDPYGVLKGHFQSTNINPFQILFDIQSDGGDIDSALVELAQTLLPNPMKSSENDWVRKGAQRILALYIEYLFRIEPTALNLGRLWEMVNAGGDAFEILYAQLQTCGHATIEARAAINYATANEATKQWEAYRSDCIDAINSFAPNTPLEIATRTNDFDFADMKERPHSVFLVIKSENTNAAAPWISLITNVAIERIAKAKGKIRTTFILDEFPQMPPAPAILKALRLYRGKLIQLWIFAQSRFSLHGKWSKENVKEFEDQAGVVTYKAVTEPELLRDLSYLSGKTTILSRGASHNGGVIENASNNLGEISRDVLQAEDIMGLGQSQQIIKIAGLPHLVVADVIPYFIIPSWNNSIKDVRNWHAGLGE